MVEAQFADDPKCASSWDTEMSSFVNEDTHSPIETFLHTHHANTNLSDASSLKFYEVKLNWH